MDGDGEAPQYEDVPYVLVYITVGGQTSLLSSSICSRLRFYPEGARFSSLTQDEAQGEELVAMLEKDTLDNFLARVAAAHAGFTLGLLIEGLHSYLKWVPFPSLPQHCLPCVDLNWGPSTPSQFADGLARPQLTAH